MATRHPLTTDDPDALGLSLMMNPLKLAKPKSGGDACVPPNKMSKCIQILESSLSKSRVACANMDAFVDYFQVRMKDIVASFEKGMAGKAD